jgi:hypothetical protein
MLLWRSLVQPPVTVLQLGGLISLLLVAFMFAVQLPGGLQPVGIR